MSDLGGDAMSAATRALSPMIPTKDDAEVPQEMANEPDTSPTEKDSITVETIEDPLMHEQEKKPASPEVKAVDGSSDSDGKRAGMITSEMLEEEEKLHQKRVNEMEERRKEEEKRMAQMDDAMREQRYKRLQFLLSKTNMYSSYLVKRMSTQAEEEQLRQERKRKRDQKKKEEQAADKTKHIPQRASSRTATIKKQETVDTPTTEVNKDSKSEPTEPGISPGKKSVLAPVQNNSQVASPRTSTRASRSNTPAASPKGTQVQENKDKSPQDTKQRKGKKRKAEDYKISDYFAVALARSKKQKVEETEGDQKETGSEEDPKQKVEETESVQKEVDSKLNSRVTVKVMKMEELETNKNVRVTVNVEKMEELETNNNVIEDKGDISMEEEGLENKVEAGEGKKNVLHEGTGRFINGEEVMEGQPDLFTGGVLREYQIDGSHWLKVLFENGVNGILADEMGLGKTVQVIATISYLVQQGVPGPWLIVAPLSTVPNWVSEFKRFTPLIPVVLYHGDPQERCALRRKITRHQPVKDDLVTAPVVITSYEIAMNDRKNIAHLEWKYIVVDEGHRIKNFECKLIRELKMYNVTHRLLLTGTPLQNNLSELWSLLNFLLPDIFDDLTSFEMWFDIDSLQSDDINQQIVVEEQKRNILSTLHQILNPFMLRRLKTDVDLLIPPKREVLVYAPILKPQQLYYKAAVDKTLESYYKTKKDENENKLVEEEVELDSKGRPKRRASMKPKLYSVLGDDEAEENPEEFEEWITTMIENDEKSQKENEVKEENQVIPKCVLNIKLANVLMILRKTCNHPYLLEYPLTADGEYKVDEELVTCSGKMILLDKMLGELKRKGHKVLLFSQMTKMMDVLEDYCFLRKYKFCRLDGSMKVQDRGDEISSFNTDPEAFLFLLSTRAGGLGLNLVAADTVIIFDSDWNPQADLQAQDRCHRIGQVRPVMVYRLITAKTIDQKIVERAAAKRKLEKMIIQKGRFKSGAFQKFDVESQDMVPLNPKDLLELLKSRDYDDVVEGREGHVISNRDLDALLDRSSLWEIWDDMRNKDKAKGEQKGKLRKNKKTKLEDVEGVFKVVEEEGNSGLLASST